MAPPNDRRVIYGAHVIPQEAIVREDSADAIYKLDTTVTKRFGGKGSVTITPDQSTDYWTSMMSLGQDWALFDERWDGTAAKWDTGTGEVAVDDSLSVILTGSTAIKFLYIKNLGSVECELALENDERDILIPPGAAVSMRTTSSVTAATVKVATADSSGNTTTIEYVIAI
jgi:hypothetical protein